LTTAHWPNNISKKQTGVLLKSFILLFLCLLTTTVFAQEYQKGLGVMLGNPTGLNGKYWLEGNRAVDAGLGFSFGKHTDFSIHSDYLFHNEGALYLNDVNPLDLYYGIGGRMEFADDVEIGLRIPVGLAHKIENGKSDIFGEIAPIIDFLTSTGVEIHLLVGARYYF
jgi:hypothetical protein